MRKLIYGAVILACAGGPVRADAAPETLKVRAAAWDAAKLTEKAWAEKLVAEVASAAADGADVVVFPEGVAQGRPLEALLADLKAAAGADRLIVLGNSAHREPGSEHAVSRAHVYAGDAWQRLDKIDPAPAERAATPPVKGGMRLVLFRFRGGLVAALPASSIDKPELSVTMKKRGVQLILVSAPKLDEASRARLERTASARAAELGAAVVIAFPAGAPALYLPAQKGFELKPRAPAGRDLRLPWRRILDLRAQPAPPDENRPFLEAMPPFQTEI